MLSRKFALLASRAIIETRTVAYAVSRIGSDGIAPNDGILLGTFKRNIAFKHIHQYHHRRRPYSSWAVRNGWALENSTLFGSTTIKSGTNPSQYLASRNLNVIPRGGDAPVLERNVSASSSKDLNAGRIISHNKNNSPNATETNMSGPSNIITTNFHEPVGNRSMHTTTTTNSTDSSATGTGATKNAKSKKTWRKAYIAVGSNQGSLYQNIATSLSLLPSSTIKLLRTSHLRLTSPMYVTDQPQFLNGAVEIETTLSPRELLWELKRVEKEMGRNVNTKSEDYVRFGPRVVDLDIILFDGDTVDGDGSVDEDDDDSIGSHSSSSSLIMQTEELEIPHPRMQEREFVLAPMVDLENADGDTTIHSDQKIIHPILNRSMSELLGSILQSNNNNENGARLEKEVDDVKAVRVIPLPRNRVLLFNETIIMGILNVTPDSFSDGGKYSSDNQTRVEKTVQAALQMERDGAGIIDIGGESTRPGAEDVALEEELRRVLPVIRRIREESDIPISIDTRNSKVAKAAIEAGADIVNDVSGGTHDSNMLSCVASMGVPMVMMHMRGNPKTMQHSSNTNYGDDNREGEGVIAGVAKELMQRCLEAEKAGIPRWLQIVDPGIGFAKNLNGNLSLLKGAEKLRKCCGNLPFLYGPSRKGFIGKISGEDDPKERDYGTIAACLATVRESGNGAGESCSILRVHNVKAMKQAVLVYEAIMKAK
mmetsp:Transcript_14737/g.30135  ORF Transcript_14737/g.30135 Transcript_14737/m.30135 type:complete len:709 (-) Transcript_14737:92-2218(-)